jgi:hypothetical protein
MMENEKLWVRKEIIVESEKVKTSIIESGLFGLRQRSAS